MRTHYYTKAMKTLFALISLVPVLAVADVADNYVNFVRQIQADSGVEWDVSVGAQGEMLSTEGVGPEGSHFQLWSIHALAAEDYLLDEGFVSAYSPSARITIETADPYDVVPRTRCDQPFRVTVDVGGLVLNPDGNPDIPAAASNVHLRHETFDYPEGVHSLDGVAEPQGVELVSGYISENGLLRLDYPGTNLTGADLTKLEGEEVFTVSSLADYGFTEAVLDSAKLQVWPIADAVVSGLDSTVEYTTVPPFTVTLRDLYPDSTTYMRVYPGPPSAAPKPEGEKIVLSSYVLIDDRVPQDRELLLDDMREYFEGSDEFTLEVLHETPFGVDILARKTVRMKQRLTVRGTLYAGGD